MNIIGFLSDRNKAYFTPVFIAVLRAFRISFCRLEPVFRYCDSTLPGLYKDTIHSVRGKPCCQTSTVPCTIPGLTVAVTRYLVAPNPRQFNGWMISSLSAP